MGWPDSIGGWPDSIGGWPDSIGGWPDSIGGWPDIGDSVPAGAVTTILVYALPYPVLFTIG